MLLLPKLSVVVPVYNSADTLLELVMQINSVTKSSECEIILVNDGSHDNSEDTIRNICKTHGHVRGITFMSNFGQANAILAGLGAARGEIVVVIDDDLQFPPSEINKLITALGTELQFVFGIPATDTNNNMRKLGSRITQKMMNIMFKKPSDLYASSFFALRRQLAAELCRYSGPYPFIYGLIFRACNIGTSVIVQHNPRRQGRSNYTIIKLLGLWLRGLTNFSVLPLRAASAIGFIIALMAFASIIIITVNRLFFGGYLVGWASLISSVMLLGGLQLMALGLLGEYVGRSYMTLNCTPQYVIKERMNFV